MFARAVSEICSRHRYVFVLNRAVAECFRRAGVVTDGPLPALCDSDFSNDIKKAVASWRDCGHCASTNVQLCADIKAALELLVQGAAAYGIATTATPSADTIPLLSALIIVSGYVWCRFWEGTLSETSDHWHPRAVLLMST